ncbi:NUDIX hydrolase [Patescibacteria group bacterium]|nr:NUDIX hydrolase [Patescibacteria group bacterium]
MKKNVPDSHLRWQELQRRRLFESPWMSVEARDYQLPDGRLYHNYYLAQESNGVTVVALTPGKKLILVRQFRPSLNTISWDFPGGAIDQTEAGTDEDPIVAAQRELLEETGFGCKDWQYIGDTQPAPHRLITTAHVLLARNCVKVAKPNEDEAEFLEVVLFTPEELEELIYQNVFTCSICIAAYFKAKKFF